MKNTNDYVREMHSYLTINQMAEELQVNPSTIGKACKRLGVEAIGIQEQQKAFILDHQKWSRKRLSTALNICDIVLCRLLDELDLSLPLDDEDTQYKPIAQRLREIWL